MPRSAASTHSERQLPESEGAYASRWGGEGGVKINQNGNARVPENTMTGFSFSCHRMAVIGLSCAVAF